jgi:hypothetical protein
VGLQLVNDEVGGITTLTLLNPQSLGKSVPHPILPLQIILLHTLIIITLSTLPKPDTTSFLQFPIHDPRNGVIVFISLVAQPKHDVLQPVESMGAVGEFESFVGEVLYELDSVVGRLAFSVGGDDEDRGAVFGKLVEVFKVVFLRVAYKRGETELGLGLLRDTNSVLFSGTRLRAVENDQSLFLKEYKEYRPWKVRTGPRMTFLFSIKPLTPLIIFATKSLGFPEPSPAFGGIVGTEEELDFKKIWSRNRYVAAATTPTPTTIASVDTVGIIEE